MHHANSTWTGPRDLDTSPDEAATASSGTGPASGAPAPRRTPRAARRPSLMLWRYRHLVVAACLGAAVAVGLGVLRPADPPAAEVLVVARPVNAGAVLTEHDLETASVPVAALPADGLAGTEVIGTRAAIALEEGTVLTTSMTSASLTVGLAPSERLVQVPVDVGAQLAQPGARVDLITQSSTMAPPGAGTEEDDGTDDAVVCAGARVVLVQAEGKDNQWTPGRKVTLITFAVPAVHASLVVSAATSGALGIVLSP